MRVIAICAALCLVHSAATAVDAPVQSTRPVDFGLAQRESTYGQVLAVTKDSILICEPEKKPASYPFHDRLAAGTVHKKVVEATSYRVADIKAGDFVSLGLVKENKQDYCVDLAIRERPGGLIPAGQIVNKDRPAYQWMNAEIAFRDKGIPIPEHLKPEGVKYLEKLNRGEITIPKESTLPTEQHPGDFAREYGKKLNLPWLFRCPERKLDFDLAQRKVMTGKVMAVQNDGVTITFPRQDKVYYQFHDRLLSKTVQSKATPDFSYRRADIKVGDIVSVGLIKDYYELCCADVSIRERPGGSVPAPQIVHKTCPYHEQRNAEIAFRDKGTPIPGHLSPILPSCAAGPGLLHAQILLAQWKLDLNPKLDFEESESVKASGVVIALTDAEITIQDKQKTVVTYPFHDRLAEGIVHKKVTEANSYRRYDVQVGDRLTLGLATENAKVFCVELSITERPDGSIPAGVIVDQMRPWYQWRNAEIAFRDKGIPILEHLKPKTPPSILKEPTDLLKK